ncbi:MAG: PfkB family carbohydrate kinase [Candidatus Ranarchaeia archaeon]
MPYDVVSFGEIMLRLSTPNFKRLEQTDSFILNPGGAEANVAVAVRRLGLNSAYVTKLTDNPLGHYIRNQIRLHGVDVSHIVWTPHDRVGIYYLEMGAAPRTNRVIYDRAYSAISNSKPEDFDWPNIFGHGTRVFHTSGITPALSKNMREVTTDAIVKAKEAGVMVSFDINYRGKLWSPKEAHEWTSPILDKIDILETTEEDTKVVLGLEGKDYEDVSQKLIDEYGFKYVLITLRGNPSVWINTWTAIANDGKSIYKGPEYRMEVVDRLGGGDSYTSGFLYGLLELKDVQKAVDFGCAFSAYKHSIPGDFAYVTREEIEKIVKGRERGLRIER